MCFRILIADGGPSFVDPSSIFPDLDIQYIRYPDDVNLSCYFAKLADALSRVETPYAMLADNDDFVIKSGCEASIKFLNEHDDYVCAGGGLGGFALYGNGVSGKINRWSRRYTYLDESLDIKENSAIDRLARGSRQWWSYYAVYRTPILQKITQEVKEINFSDMQLHEFYCAMRMLTLGKAYNDPTCFSYFRQYGTSMEGFRKDWVHHMLRSNFNRDLKVLIDKIANATDEPIRVGSVLYDIFDKWLNEFLHIYYGSAQSVKHIIRKWPRTYGWLKNHRRSRFRIWLERQAILNKTPSARTDLETIEGLCR